MILPLVTSLGVAGVNTPAVLLGLTVVAAFLAHEPLLVLLGRRGARAKREHWLIAVVWFGISAATVLGAGLVAFWAVSSALRWSFALPLVPAALLAGAIVSKREKSLLGELVVALAFSLIAVPVCLAAGATTTTALAIGTTFALVFFHLHAPQLPPLAGSRRGPRARIAGSG
jgi:hypothetical protein